MKSSSIKGDNPGEVAAVSAAAAIHTVGPILENRASTLLRLKKVNSGAHLEVSVNHAGYLNLIHSSPWEHSGSVKECLTRDRGAVGLSLTGFTAMWSLSKTHLS